MKKTFLLCATLAIATLSLNAQKSATISVRTDEGSRIIPKEIYGHFSEHLGTLIYGGLWVGENSSLPNTNGYRTDVVNALRDLKIPVLRWPGGCFADEYHWMDGIGPRNQRPKLVNTHWGGTVEDNSFGTHEFLNLCEMLGIEPYVSVNVGSGTVEETYKWVEYMTSDADSPMANLRRQNGRQEPWKVKYLGIGNECWGCGGNMRPEYYADVYRQFATFSRNFGGNRLYKVGVGPSGDDYNWMRVVMQNAGSQMNGISLHYYTVNDWGHKGSATQFDKDGYYSILSKTRYMEEMLQKHIAIMNQYDPRNRVALIVDEWGTWWDEEPGTVRGHLFQQSTMRDAMVASLNFDIFHKYTDRVKMANIAQIVNVLQAMILTNDKGGMLLTPTYHVFRMYNVHQDATWLPTDVSCDWMDGGDRPIPLVSATASKDAAGVIHLSVSNVDADNAQTITVNLPGVNARTATGEILASGSINDHNTFENPDKVKPVPFKEARIERGVLKITLPPASIVTLALK
jgi:alpha-N-arabinofuranosidase